jgi:hypothetical protein
MAARLNVTFRDQSCSWLTREEPPIGALTSA